MTRPNSSTVFSLSETPKLFYQIPRNTNEASVTGQLTLSVVDGHQPGEYSGTLNFQKVQGE
jgi:hypothetical protein